MNNFRSQLTSKKRKDQELEARMARGWEERNQETSPNVLSLKKTKETPSPYVLAGPLSLTHGGWDLFVYTRHRMEEKQGTRLKLVLPHTHM